jgi:hypothetical protein
MRLKWKIALLLFLIGTALFTGAEALRSLRQVPDRNFPAEIYARFARNADSAAFFLRRDGAYIAVFPSGRGRDPLEITRIELQGLRRADRAMIEAGLPVSSRQELLQLLEDLGS